MSSKSSNLIRLPISFLYYTYLCFYDTQCTFSKSFLIPFLCNYMQCTCNAKVFNYCQTHTFHFMHGLNVTLPSGVKSTLAWKSVLYSKIKTAL